MKLRLPIPAKLLLWFTLNLVLLTAGFYALFRWQFGGVSNGLFASIAGPAVQRIAEDLGEELRNYRTDDEWTAVLQRRGKALGVDLALFIDPGHQTGGSPMVLPTDLAEKLEAQLPEAPRRDEIDGRPDQPPPRRGEPGDALSFLLDGDPPDHPPEPPPGRGRPGMRKGRAPMQDLDVEYLKFAMRAGNPASYWVVVRVPVLEAPGGYHPMLLVLRSDSMSGGGLFFDPKPWLICGFGAVLISVLLWSPLALGLTGSLRRVTAATQQIAGGDFSVRVPDSNRMDELGTLGAAVNQLAERLDGYVSGQRRFMGDVAHELCSPIARMQAALGILSQQADDSGKQNRLIGRLESELGEMSQLVSEVLSFSKAALGQTGQGASLELVPLADVVAEVIEREKGTASVESTLVPEALVWGDARLIARALANVLRNAVRYAAEGGPIQISAVVRHGKMAVTVADRGPGVAEENLPRIFDAFYRPDASRTRRTGGAGLGLAIVKSCVEACGGEATAANREGGGLAVTMTFWITEPPKPSAPGV